MPFTFSVAEYAGMIYVYGFCDGNSVHAVAEYQQRFPNRRIPNRSVQFIPLKYPLLQQTLGPFHHIHYSLLQGG